MDQKTISDCERPVSTQVLSHISQGNKKNKNFNHSVALNKLNIQNDFVDKSHILIIGKRSSGKTLLACDIAYNLNIKKKFDNAIVLTCDNNKNVYLKQLGITAHYNSKESISNFFNIIKEHFKTCDSSLKKNTIIPSLLVIIDDINNENFNSVFEEVIYNGRHYNITTILTKQFSSGLSPELRCNFDYVFLFKDDVISNIKRLYEHYAGMFPTFKSFNDVILSMGSNALVISNSKKSNYTFDDIVKFYSINYDNKCVINPFNTVPIINPPNTEFVQNPANNKHQCTDKQIQLLKEIIITNTNICEIIKNNPNSINTVEILSQITVCNNIIINLLQS